MIILGFLSLLLDLIILNFSNYAFNSLNLFFPYLTLVFVVFYFYLNKKINNYYLYILLFLYSLIVVNNIAFTIILFSLIYLWVKYLKERTKDNLSTFLLIMITSIIIYDATYFLFLVLFRCLEFNVFFLFYKVFNSLILNLFYGIILYFTIPVLKFSKR